MKANKAYELSKSDIKKSSRKIRKVLKQVKKAAKEGYTSISDIGFLTPNEANKLIDLDYELELNKRCWGYNYYRISWEQDND